MDALTIATISLDVCTGLLVVVGIGQWRKMAIHAEHLEALATQTKEIAEVARRSAVAAEKTAAANVYGIKARIVADTTGPNSPLTNRLNQMLREFDLAIARIEYAPAPKQPPPSST